MRKRSILIPAVNQFPSLYHRAIRLHLSNIPISDDATAVYFYNLLRVQGQARYPVDKKKKDGRHEKGSAYQSYKSSNWVPGSGHLPQMTNV